MATATVGGLRPASIGLAESSLREPLRADTAATRSLLTDEAEKRVRLPLRGRSLLFELSGDEPKWFYPTLSCFQQLLQLPEGWDSYGADVITDEAIVGAAEALVQLQLPFEAPPPSVVPGSSGSVQLEWHAAGADVEIYVSPEGHLAAFLSDAGQELEFETLCGVAVAKLGQVLFRMAS